jgi:hypothetical protein
MPGALARRGIRMTNRANNRCFDTEKLRAVTAQTRFVFRVIGDIGKRFAFFSDTFPVGRRKFMTGIAGKLFVRSVAVRKIRGSSIELF